MKATIAAILILATPGVMAGTCNARQRVATAESAAPRVFSLPPVALERLRSETMAGKQDNPAIEKLRKDAAAELQQPPLSVTDKSIDPPSGDKHDYLSLAPYWWPDPSKPDGLPYIRRDGETNPEIQRLSDHRNFDKLMNSAHTLALAYFFFGDETCAAHATRLLRAWFLDSATRMNPNLQFAQGIRGRNTGRGIGLIETRGIYRVVDAVGLLAGSKAWTPADQNGIEDWCAQFLDWMLHSENGKAEAAAKNNHGTYYDVQIVSLALFTGNREVAKRTLDAVPAKRIGVQIELDGRQPLELARTKSLGYSTMNLAGLFELALLGENAGVDLWNFQPSDGRGIRKALDYLLPFVGGREKWPYQQIAAYKASEIAPLLIVAGSRFKDRRYSDIAVRIDPAVASRIDSVLQAEIVK